MSVVFAEIPELKNVLDWLEQITEVLEELNSQNQRINETLIEIKKLMESQVS
jgi:hypothetical protein